MARTVASSFGNQHSAGDVPPMAEMNTTPLIDVMLVLLIMFIITVPTQTHQIEQALPGPDKTLDVNPVRNELGLSATGQLDWNGRAISDQELAGALGAIAGMDRQAEVHFRPDAAVRYERVDQVLAIAAKSGATSFGFAGNEQYRDSF